MVVDSAYFGITLVDMISKHVNVDMEHRDRDEASHVSPRTRDDDRPFSCCSKSHETLSYDWGSLQKAQNNVAWHRSVQIDQWSPKGTSRSSEELATIVRSRTMYPQA